MQCFKKCHITCAKTYTICLIHSSCASNVFYIGFSPIKYTRRAIFEKISAYQNIYIHFTKFQKISNGKSASVDSKAVVIVWVLYYFVPVTIPYVLRNHLPLHIYCHVIWEACMRCCVWYVEHVNIFYVIYLNIFWW